ncbi:NAD/NADP-dependent octopine/nopaline dehydrogenase family protein [Jeotgalibaca caeni]|uniref:NAD/NADP-dependent octopine/nopaline dehydrogenase family protein n=1 Tax=Jeotgalibaca caeni TaxID=3028623 RepID=UPI00237D7F05|nr:NAD/NADP-dependent octopine/nopaline dehydrogenase family protein [Jeotgalibaca caeni]MDE1548203.1 NAD/NADP octopine/nopaline dehydrogenase family protein [Jeotgalibaca caeni]
MSGMRITVIGAGNSGLAMAAHLSLHGDEVTLWNRTRAHIEPLIDQPIIHCSGSIEGAAVIAHVTDDLAEALANPAIVFVTTPAFSHKLLAQQMGAVLTTEPIIILNPGRTFGALEFRHEMKQVNAGINPLIAETQTILYTCRKQAPNRVEVYALKNDVLLSTIEGTNNEALIGKMPLCLQDKFIPASSMIETSIGNVGMIMHCAPILFNTGWVEATDVDFYYYRQGISPTVALFIEKMDQERLAVATLLGHPIESAMEWMKRTYHVPGETLYDVIQNNHAYDLIAAPTSLFHRYVTEDIPTGLVPLEAVGKELGLPMKHIGLIIDLASTMLDIDFRKEGRNLQDVIGQTNISPRKILI